MRIKLVSSPLEFQPALQTKKNTQGINTTTTKTIMDYTTDPRNIEEQTNRSAAAAAVAAATAAAGQANSNRQAPNLGQNPDNRIPYQTYNSQSQSQSQSLPFSNSQEPSIQMASTAAAPVYRTSDYHPHVPQQQAPQHAAYQQYAPSSQGYLQQPPNQMSASHYPGTQHDYAAPGFPQQQGHLQAPPQAPFQQQQQQTAYGIQEPTMQTHSHIAMQTSYTQRTGARSILERPVIKLSVNLIDTYKRINEAYYERKREAAAAENAEKRNEPRGQGVHNHGWDDEHYDYILRNGEILEGRYRISERIGKGSFGQVVRAFDIETNKDVAIKIIKSRRPFLLQARTEIDLLTHLKTQDPNDQNNIGKSSLGDNYLIHTLTNFF